MQHFLLGTYTRQESKGIYRVSLNRQEKKLENLELIARVENPTYLDTSSDGSLLFAVLKEGELDGGVIAYKKNNDGLFDVVNTSTEEGAAPCFVSYDEKRNYLYSANYHKGEVALYGVSSTGAVSLLDSALHEGKGPHQNQDGPHAHYMQRTPDDQFVVSCDLGTDEVITYRVKEDALIQQHILKVTEGTGPRHLVFHPTLPVAYLVGELSSEILVLDYHSDGSFTAKQRISTVPEGYTGSNSGAAIRVSQNGQHVYASNRGHDSIVVYETHSEGRLTTVQWQPTFGEVPRDFNFDETDTFLIVGHQNTPALTLLERDQTNGTLSVLQTDFFAPEVVCVHGLSS